MLELLPVPDRRDLLPVLRVQVALSLSELLLLGELSHSRVQEVAQTRTPIRNVPPPSRRAKRRVHLQLVRAVHDHCLQVQSTHSGAKTATASTSAKFAMQKKGTGSL